MSEKKDAIHGLSIVDATTTGHAEEDKKDNLVLRIDDEDDSAAHHDNVSEDHEESYLEEVEEKIKLFDVLNEKEEAEKEVKNNSTLIITTEEHLETTACDNTFNASTETVKNVKITTNESTITDSSFEEPKTTPTNAKSKCDDHGYFWVSNITKHVKATDLKKFFSQIGKVITAKILTNGKSYFGYLSVDTTKTAAKCIKQMNNTLFDGKKIVVSKDRPDLRESKSMVKLPSRRNRNEKLEIKESKAAEPKAVIEIETKKSKMVEEEETKVSNAIAELNNKLDKSNAEIGRYKYKILEYQRRHDGMRKKCIDLEKELKETQYKLHADRRRLNQDRELFEKNKKLDLIRMEADKAVINKELDEVKKLREHLKAKIEEIKAQTKKNAKRRSRSPPPPPERSRSPRVRSPVMRISSRIAYRADDRLEKKRKREEPSRGRTPPPPPKLTNGIGKKRGDNLSHRQYFDVVDKRSSPLQRGHGYEYRHKPSFPPSQEVSRSPWQVPYPKDPRRVNVAPSSSQSYPPDPRYGAGYQFPPSSIAVPQRSYYPEFGKSYAHY